MLLSVWCNLAIFLRVLRGDELSLVFYHEGHEGHEDFGLWFNL
jgi:hypothetical protein